METYNHAVVDVIGSKIKIRISEDKAYVECRSFYKCLYNNVGFLAYTSNKDKNEVDDIITGFREAIENLEDIELMRLMIIEFNIIGIGLIFKRIIEQLKLEVL